MECVCGGGILCGSSRWLKQAKHVASFPFPPGLQRMAMRDSSKEAVRALMLAAMGECAPGRGSGSPQHCIAVQPAVGLAQARQFSTAPNQHISRTPCCRLPGCAAAGAAEGGKLAGAPLSADGELGEAQAAGHGDWWHWQWPCLWLWKAYIKRNISGTGSSMGFGNGFGLGGLALLRSSRGQEEVNGILLTGAPPVPCRSNCGKGSPKRWSGWLRMWSA